MERQGLMEQHSQALATSGGSTSPKGLLTPRYTKARQKMAGRLRLRLGIT